MTQRMTALALLLALAAPLLAPAAEPRDLPADTKWVLRLDLKAAQAAPLMSAVIGKIAPAKRREAQAKLAAFKALFGVDLLQDIREVVIAGEGQAEKGGVAYIYATFDTARLTTILAGNPTFTSTDQNGFKLLSWTDDADKKQKFGAFVRPGLTVLSDRRESLVGALEVLAGQRAGLPADSPLRPAVASGAQDIVSLMAADVPAIVGNQPKAQALRQAQSLAFRIHAARPDTLSAALTVTAPTGETALQIQRAFLGIQALSLLNAAEAPEQATLAQHVKVAGDGQTVTVTLDLPQAVIEEAVRQHHARTAPPQPPAAATPAVLTPAN